MSVTSVLISVIQQKVETGNTFSTSEFVQIDFNANTKA